VEELVIITTEKQNIEIQVRVYVGVVLKIAQLNGLMVHVHPRAT